jgi:hypothetical protein
MDIFYAIFWVVVSVGALYVIWVIGSRICDRLSSIVANLQYISFSVFRGKVEKPK